MKIPTKLPPADEFVSAGGTGRQSRDERRTYLDEAECGDMSIGLRPFGVGPAILAFWAAGRPGILAARYSIGRKPFNMTVGQQVIRIAAMDASETAV